MKRIFITLTTLTILFTSCNNNVNKTTYRYTIETEEGKTFYINSDIIYNIGDNYKAGLSTLSIGINGKITERIK